MRILNLIINKFTSDKVLKAAYLEKPLNEKYEDIHLHLIFKQEINKKDIFAIIKGLLDDATYITYYVIKDDVFHAVSEDNISIYFYIDKKNYSYKNKTYLYDPDDLDSDDSFKLENKDIITMMVHHIHEYINELHNAYEFYKEKEEALSLVCLNRSVDYLFKFLSCYYLANPGNHSFNDIFEVMEVDKRKELKQALQVISISNIFGCLKMFVWFIDYYINGLPITITKKIDIDYYLYIKKLILGVMK